METLKGNHKACDYINFLFCSVLSILWNLVGNYGKRQEPGNYLFHGGMIRISLLPPCFNIKVNNKNNWFINLFKYDNEDLILNFEKQSSGGVL